MTVASAPGPSRPRSDILRFNTHRHLRQRLLLSILSGKSIRIDHIRSEDIHVGLTDYEINLLRLVERVTNGSTVEVSVTGEARQLGRMLTLQVHPSSFIPACFREDLSPIRVTSADPWDTISSSSSPSRRSAKAR